MAGYDVYGNVGHQLNSRLYMDFMRMEGEFNFLVFLPQALRESTALYWYRGATDEAREYVYGKNAYLDAESAIPYRSNDPQRELYELLGQRLAPVLDTALRPGQRARRTAAQRAAVAGRASRAPA